MYVSNLYITLLLHEPFPSLHPYPKCSLTPTLLIVYFYLQNQTNLSPQSYGTIGCLHFFYFETVYFQALATFTISQFGYLLSVFFGHPLVMSGFVPFYRPWVCLLEHPILYLTVHFLNRSVWPSWTVHFDPIPFTLEVISTMHSTASVPTAFISFTHNLYYMI